MMQMKKGDVVSAPDGDRQLILRLADIVDIGADENPEAKGKIAGELSTDVPKEIAEQYLRHLRTLFPVDIHRDVMETVNAQGS